MTPQEYNILNKITYSDFGFDGSCDTSLSLQEMCRQAINNSPKNTKPDVLECMRAVTNGEYPGLSNLTMKGGVNNNDTTGLVAYAFQDGDTVICAYRGSEPGDNAKDWVDNIASGVTGIDSVQYREALAFALEMGQGANLEVTGHSKGGNLAMYVASQTEVSGGYAFDGQGFPNGYLSRKEIQRLRDSGLINYVTYNDWVGTLLNHPENRRFVDGKNDDDYAAINNHDLLNMKFDENGNPIPAEQCTATKVWEASTSGIQKVIEPFPGFINLAEHLKRKFIPIQFGFSSSDRITVPLDEMTATIGRYELAHDELEDSYVNLSRAMDALDKAWKGIAYLEFRYQLSSIRGNIERADEKMQDAVDELKKTYDIFTNVERSNTSMMAGLDIGTSPFD